MRSVAGKYALRLSFIASVPASGRLRPDNMVQHIKAFTHHDFDVRCQPMATEQVKTSGRFQHPPELRQTLVQPLQVIFITLPTGYPSPQVSL